MEQDVVEGERNEAPGFELALNQADYSRMTDEQLAPSGDLFLSQRIRHETKVDYFCCMCNDNSRWLLHMQQDVLSPTGYPAIVETLKRSLHWVSILMRLSIGTLFLCAAIVKTPFGIPGIIAYYSSLLDHSLLPASLVKAHAVLILFFEYGLAIWLFSGWRLRFAWKVGGVLLVSLAIGMIFAGKYDVANANYVYAFLCAVGLFSSEFDRWQVGRLKH